MNEQTTPAAEIEKELREIETTISKLSFGEITLGDATANIGARIDIIRYWLETPW